MKSLLCASLIFLFTATASAQFSNSPALRGKAPEADAAKTADKPADPPANPGDPIPVGAPGAGTGAPNALFAALDTDGDGVISKAELKKAILSLKKLDANNDGNITLAECGGDAAAAGGVGAVANDATQWLDRIMAKDKNGDGRLTPDELNENERQMLQGADLNGDGAIDRQELAAMGTGRGEARGNLNGNLAGGANGAGAAGRRGNEAMGRFFQYDRNHDGRLTANEVPPQMMGVLRGGDTNGDGAIDAGELQAIAARMGDRMKAWGAGAEPNAGPPGGENNRKRPRNQN